MKTNLSKLERLIKDLTGVSVNTEDTPEIGGMIAINPQNQEDRWYVAKKFFDDNYELAE